MTALLRRTLIVLLGLLALALFFQRVLTRDGGGPASAAVRTRAVTIVDLLEANVPLPTRTRVSFPAFSYRDAHPEADDSPEIVISGFDEAPMVKFLREGGRAGPGDGAEDVARWREWQRHYVGDLPPVEQRLPLNPAVTVGPDGVGRYGGTWRRVGESGWYFIRNICYESLTRYDPAGRIQPCLAYKWEVSPDWRSFTFHLRPGHRWSDGELFTAHDITWTCNTVIGSEYWSILSDWMLARDGASLLYEEDVASWPDLAARIVAESRSDAPSPGRQLRSLAERGLWERIERTARGEANEPAAASRITNALNELFRKSGFYDERAFADVDLDVERRELEKAGISTLDKTRMDLYLVMLERADLLRRLRAGPESPEALQSMDIPRLNLLLFRAAYRDRVSLPLRDRVKVEAVPDANGDDRHIIRFTFRKPNSIFLEQTATFMFYRGLFNLPRHTTRHMHPDGSILLAPSDFWQWEKFWQMVQAEARREADSPGKRLWDRLDDSTRQKVQAGLPPRASGETDWQYDRRVEGQQWDVIHGVNAVLPRGGFYDPAAWPAIDLEAARKELLGKKGFARMARDLGVLRQYRDLLVLEDLLRRLKRDGPELLSAEDHAKINVAMLRAAYATPGADSVLGPTRLAGLNRAAARDPRRFDSWTDRLFHRTEYHPLANPHHPTLGAWRLIDENEKPEITAIRNPYYYRVDANGNQLPYLDAVRTYVSNQREIRLLKLRSGSVEFQSSDILFDDFPILKRGELESNARGDRMYQVRLWASDSCGGLLFVPLQPHQDPSFRRLQEDPNFRHAMSLALNREEIIDVSYRGIGAPVQRSSPYGSPYYNPHEASAFVEYDPDRAERLLDAMGLDRRGPDGMRLLWDGRPMILDLNIAQDFPLVPARLATRYWQAVGLNVQMKYRTSGMIARLEGMGRSDIRAMIGGGNFFGPMLPAAYYPSNPAEATQWRPWCSYMRSGGRDGEPPPERIHELERMWIRLATSPNQKAKMEAWKALTDRAAADLPTIGVTTSPGQVVYVREGFKNVPKIAMAGLIAHDPGNCCPETFFFEAGK